MSHLQMSGGTVSQDVVVDKRFTAESDLQRDISTQSAEMVRYTPIGGVAGAQVEFQVEPSSSGYIDLKNSYILSEVRILKAGGQVVPSDYITLKAYQSLLEWSDIQTTVNGVNLSDENSGQYPYSAWAKVALEESNLTPSVATVIPANADGLSVLSSSDSREDQGIITPNSGGLCGGLSSMTSQYQRIRYFNETVNGGYVGIKTQPKEGLWSQQEYLQPNLRLRIVLTKNDPNVVIEDANTTTTANTLDYASCNLYLRRVYPTQSMATIAKEVQMNRGMLYNLLRARTTQIQYNSNQTSLTATGLLAGQNPSVVVVMFNPVYNTTQKQQIHPFNTTQQNTPSSLYLRSGGARFPPNYDYERLQVGSAQGSIVDYNEYVLACKASSHNSTISDNQTPLLSRQAYQGVSFFVFNVKQNQETMYGRDDSSNSKGSVDVYAKFPAGGTDSQSIMTVVGLGHDQVHITEDGRVSRVGW